MRQHETLVLPETPPFQTGIDLLVVGLKVQEKQITIKSSIIGASVDLYRLGLILGPTPLISYLFSPNQSLYNPHSMLQNTSAGFCCQGHEMQTGGGKNITPEINKATEVTALLKNRYLGIKNR